MKTDPTDRRTPLDKPDWRYVDKVAMEDFRAEDWALLDRQRAVYYAEHQAEIALRLLTISKHDTTFGYQVNNYRHCLQSATMVMRDGLDDETIAVALLHDIGFVACPTTHGLFAAAMMAPYISPANRWMLERHQIFGNLHVHDRPTTDRHARERWRGHPFFEWTATFVEKYDQATVDPDYDCAPIEAFRPMVHRLFARPPQPLEPPA